MIVLSNTRIADAAMLASRWLQEMASSTCLPGFVEYMIIRVTLHLLLVIFSIYDRRRGHHGLVSEMIWQYAEKGHW